MSASPPSLSTNNATRDLEAAIPLERDEPVNPEREDYYHRHVVKGWG
ncbi:MAG: hypothetical protein KR126chlam4_01353 [Candidatus Anoxychlamydiales bacterium]|nr:hypothetical protein [Candidatus Anoxychlamydiales bacterium]NGX41512.1 hypothetical protein [Candidatus Anoxychlamydiales bacterium]